MTHFEWLERRAFIAQLGKGVLGIAILGGAAACGDGEVSTTTAAAATSAGPTSAGPTSAGPTSTQPAPTTTGASGTTAAPTTAAPATTVGSGSEISVERVNLGNVSAYILVRGTEAAIVDTGNPGSEDAIESSLVAVGLSWVDVGHVILTHLHGDHIGSVGAVMTAATEAAGYAGAADIARIDAPRALTPVATGDTVFGLDIVSTPGHTPGHISVFDPESRSLIAGDALNGAGSGMPADAGIAGPNPQYTPDMELAFASLVDLAALAPNAVFFGHGEPLLQDAAAALNVLALG